MVDVLDEVNRFDVATAAIKGGRDYQEDSLIASFPQGQETGFAVLADGMGGHLSGDVASALVMTEVFSRIKLKEMLLDKQITDVSALLYNTASAANARITQHIEEAPETYGMGSTLLATVIRGDELYWVSVGDSPLLLFRDGELRQLNQDHSMAPQIDMMVKVGAMDPEVGRNHPDRNTLTSAIAGVDIDKIDCPDKPTAILPGDIIIIASDGLQFLSNDTITAILHETQDARSSDISDALLKAVAELDDPDQDNTVFTVVKLGERKQATQPAAQDTASVLVQLRSDLGRPVPAQASVADEAAPEVADQEPAAATQEQADMPTRRVIRLVTSNSRSFDKPAAPAPEAAPAEQVRPQGHTSWYRRQRSLND
ncbi:PP2C family serine/threonine-protein phosphatase [Yoonia sp.]|uniref:PP2C family protein-serine/threonine phosphatase n=1 Tax=Yoonia sp. TaxID=2212373 RepID=UPI00358F0E52